MASTMRRPQKKKPATITQRTRTASTDGKRFPTHEQIEQRAHESYEQLGRPSGRDVELWLEAERQLRKEHDA